MKMERLNQDKIRIFLTFDDLMERGIRKEDMWREIPKVHELFSEMMEQAYNELGFDASGPLAVEVLVLPAQGMVVIVTRNRPQQEPQPADEEGFLEEDREQVYEMEVTLEETDTVTYAFRDFETLLEVVRCIRRLGIEGGSLHVYKGVYVFRMRPEEVPSDRYHAVIALLSEYGEATSVTAAVLDEYGKTILSERAVGELCERFGAVGG
ncbi:MAG: adaptor protein [Candidatus Reconcilbacillus cellulovorans]|uniref:Adaptor protein n=1 Tax=Candidatus Reconcilbacillus cellulovorans TaxID=1906605 RepID=A0A2A6E017_9BACL|nr:MAG: adaptor protein [Candidatus Reconcilbacillus cellulovorans]